MQTFLPYPDFRATAKALDTKRLGKQRVEVLQILNVLTDPTRKGWRNHPAVIMWRGHEGCLVRYGVAICEEWQSRGFKDTVKQKLLDRNVPDSCDPFWLGDERLHSSHRANLIRKDAEYYAGQGWTEIPGEYYWPTPPDSSGETPT